MENFRILHNINFTTSLNLCSKLKQYADLYRLRVRYAAG